MLDVELLDREALRISGCQPGSHAHGRRCDQAIGLL
jgi:hypothetical protein